ncbi:MULTISPECIES: beta-glucuronidase [unclassified Jeotgalibaca]|uniref:beta-glucuronidase n=1 Tax=unclassified Jeotgalibaca TaxID=2621505 RepID=UPI003FD23DE3
MLYPIMTESRTVLDLNGIWKFLLANDEILVDTTRPLETDGVMAVPGSFNDQGAIDKIRFHVGDVWYEREFSLPKTVMNERLVLRFGSVTHFATVYVNGKQIFEHKGGFTPFEVAINDYVKAGKNRLTLKVNNVLDYTTLPVGMYKEYYDEDLQRNVKKNEPNFDFFNYAGIHRPVKIYTTPASYIEDLIFTFDVEGANATIHPDVKTVGSFDEVKITALDEEGNVVATSAVTDSFTIENFQAWEPMAAYLYTMRVEGIENGEVVDVYEEELGIRTVEVKDGKFLINNKPFYFKGFGKHEDTHINGRGLNEAANVLDLNLFRWIGANSFRTSHYPYSEEMMRLANQQGIVVIDEVPAVGLFVGFNPFLVDKGDLGRTFDVMNTRDAHEQALRELVDRDKNLACVVMWSVANEPASHEEGSAEYFEPLTNFVRDYDPQHRPATIVFIQHSSPTDNKVSDFLDVICLNRYYGWYGLINDLDGAEVALRKELQAWKERHPDKPIIFTEYGADTVAGYHSISSAPFTEEYQVRYYEANHKVFDEFDLVIGEQVWNFADFETAPATKRVNGNKKGIFTRERQPKMIAHHLKQRWTKIPDFGFKE